MNKLLISTLFFAFVAVSVAAPARAEALAVVVSSKLDVDSLTEAQLRQIFLGEPVKAGGKKVIPLNLPPNSAARQAFDQAVLGMGPDEVPRFWVDQRIRGKASPPKTIPSSSTVVRLVEKLPGAIGYVELSEVTPGVRVIAIDGKKPGDDSYPLSE